MARRVFFHIGPPKTGTTFLQTRMWHNREQLRKQGFLYPGDQRMDHYHASQEVRGAGPGRLGDRAGAWQRLVEDLHAWDGDGLVSHEFYSMAKAGQAKAAVAALAPAEVTVVLTVRDYVLQFPAMWQEALKMNSELTFDEFMQQALARKIRGGWSWDSQNLPPILRRWSKAVPASRVKIITVPPTSGGELLWHRWLDVLGVDDTGFELDLAFSNTSLGAAQAALLHRIKPHLSESLNEGAVRHRWVRAYFGHQVLVPQQGERFGPRPQHVNRLRKRSRAAIEAIREGGYSLVGDLDDLVSAVPPTGTHPDDVDDAQLVDVAARAIEQMIRDVRELTIERDEWRARAEEPVWRKVGRLVRRDDSSDDEGLEE